MGVDVSLPTLILFITFFLGCREMPGPPHAIVMALDLAIRRRKRSAWTPHGERAPLAPATKAGQFEISRLPTASNLPIAGTEASARRHFLGSSRTSNCLSVRFKVAALGSVPGSKATVGDGDWAHSRRAAPRVPATSAFTRVCDPL